jgi:hypothetical protein
MSMHSRFGALAVVALLAIVTGAQGQQAPVGTQAAAGRVGGRPLVGPVVTDRYRSSFVKLGGTAVDGLLYEPVMPGPNARVAVLYSNSSFNFDPPAAELASRGYRVLFVPHPQGRTGEVASPFDGFVEASRGIAYLRTLPGVARVVVAGWGSGAVTMTLYADVAAHGPASCLGKEKIYPCRKEQASGLAKPDGLILFDPGLGSGSKVNNIDPAFAGDTRSNLDLDMFTTANGYDVNAGTATYSTDFSNKYFAAQSARNTQVIHDALARLKALDHGGNGSTPSDEPLIAPGAVNVGAAASLHNADLRFISHTKRPYTLLKADGSKPVVILHSVRPTTTPVGAEAIQNAVARYSQPGRVYTVREFLANDAIRSTSNFALTEDDVIGVDWKSSNTGTPAQAEGVTVPTLVMTNSCFQFIVASEIVYDHLAAKDKTFAGVEGSEHFFRPCGPQYGDTTKRLFDFVGDWLGKPQRF